MEGTQGKAKGWGWGGGKEERERRFDECFGDEKGIRDAAVGIKTSRAISNKRPL